MKGTKSNFFLKCIVFFLFIAVGITLIFSKGVEMSEEKALSEEVPTSMYDILAMKDLDNSYPSTVSEVLKLYDKYIQYIHNNPLDDDQFDALVDKMRMMWAKEWLDLNDREEHIANYKKEVKDFIEAGKVISNYVVDDSTSAGDFVTPDGVKGKTLTSSYLYSEKKTTYKIYLKYYFLQEEGKWKILYYEAMDTEGDNGSDSSSSETEE